MKFRPPENREGENLLQAVLLLNRICESARKLSCGLYGDCRYNRIQKLLIKTKGILNMNTVISNNLKKFRQQKNLTQEQAAEALGVNAHTVSRWECSTTLPDVTMLPELARLYSVTVDDFFKESASAYENYARRLASVFDTTRDPEDFIRADREFQRLLKTGDYEPEDLRIYGILHQFMAKYCENKALNLFDRILDKAISENDLVYRRTRHQKMLLLVQLGRGQENIDAALEKVNAGSESAEDWICLIAAYQYCQRWEEAYTWFRKAIQKFPDKAELHAFGGDICKQLGRYEEALSHWDRALQKDNTFYDVMYSKAFYYEEAGEYEKAYKLWCEIVNALKKDGYDIEAAAEEKRAQACFEKIKRS